MRSIARSAFLAAIPVELVNYWIVGYPAAPHPLTSASQNAPVALQWYVLHLPGIIASDHSAFLRHHGWACSLVLLLIGYIDTVLLLALALLALRLVLQGIRRLSSPLRHAL